MAEEIPAAKKIHRGKDRQGKDLTGKRPSGEKTVGKRPKGEKMAEKRSTGKRPVTGKAYRVTDALS